MSYLTHAFDGRLDRNSLKRTAGDAINALPCRACCDLGLTFNDFAALLRTPFRALVARHVNHPLTQIAS